MKKRLIVRAREWYVNLMVTRIEKCGDVIFAYNEDGFCGMFDLGAIDVIYISEPNGPTN